VVQDGTTRIQRTLRTTLASVAADVRAQEIAPPAVIVVGPVAGLVAGPVSCEWWVIGQKDSSRSKKLR
jgi:uroporphyrin-III C-methyltransferase/precorrin-2 dehydrogenase/sirohydrochlorin ferrochelatase